MSRGIPASLVSAFNSDAFYLATLLRISRGGTVFNLTDAPNNLTFGSTYVSQGFILEMSQASESQELRVNDMTISLSGVNQAFIASFLNDNNFVNDTVTVLRAVYNPANNAVSGAMVYFEGRIANYGIDEDEDSSTVAITVSSHWADFEKVNGRKTNQNSQQQFFPNDLGFQYASKVVKDLRWGRKG